ncbi:hypothetical protein B0H66DRAFT_598052 [Apodospora peruviana]|uniref:Coenzyme Q-binding protein COQ10 START domain-containing protein n=1 Tax=Apodospora peruviana TaxID=516989 RepID=A0AAE0ISR4_9PEZI|nr:hypothetical protein B0H66DRAFT_598052 [Apodospora peruviana]
MPLEPAAASSFPSEETPATLALPPITTPTHGTGGTFSVACSTRIAAAPLICLDLVLKSEQYPSWNKFCRKCTIDQQPRPDTTTPGTGIPGLPDLGSDYLKLGTKFTFDVHMNPDDDTSATGRATALEVSVLEHIDEEEVMDLSGSSGGPAGRQTMTRAGWRVAWKTRTSSPLMPGWMLRSERVQEFVEVDTPFGPRDEPETAYRCWETFYGVLAPVVRMAVGGQLVNGFNVWMRDLKKRAEELERSEGAFAPSSSA